MPQPIKNATAKSFDDGTYLFQGYKPGEHPNDVTKLAGLYRTGKLANPSKEQNSKMTEQLLLGQSAKNCTNQFIKELERIRNKISGGKRYTHSSNTPEVNAKAKYWFANIKSGSLKGAKRIHEKAVIYSAKSKEANPPELMINNVRDVLRATIVFETVEKLEEWCSGSGPGKNIIDFVNSKFPVLRVKNRFVGDALPQFKPFASLNSLVQLYNEKKKEHVTRDSFYRDIQMLVLLDSSKGFKTAPFTHHIAEVQISIEKMMGAKKVGHKAYENIRVIDGYIEMKKIFEKNKDNARVAELLKLKVPKMDIVKSFYDDTQTMGQIYRDALKGDLAPDPIRMAINNSNWYKKNM